MDVLFEKLLMTLLLWVLQLVDDIFGIFRQLAGIDNVEVAGEETDIISVFLNSPLITKVFFGILVVAIVVCAISMIVAIIKHFINMNGGERKSIAKISGQGLGTIFITLAMAGIMISGIFIANTLLQDVSDIFNVDEQTLSNEIFKNSVGGYTIADPIYDDPSTNFITETKENPVWQVDENGDFVLDEDGNKVAKVFGYTYRPSEESGWASNKNINNFDVTNESADSIFGTRSKNLIGLEDSDKRPKGDYWLELGSFNYVVGYFSAIIILVAVASACLGLIKRLYDIVILFLSLPLIVSTIPLDDGARFKVWRETVISKVVIAYGAVFAVNVFLLMIPIIGTFEGAAILKMLLMVGGGLSISGGILLFARLFGTDAAESRDLAQSARTLLAGTMATGKAFGAVTNVASNILGKTGSAGLATSNFLEKRLNPILNTASAKSNLKSATSGVLSPAAMPGSELGEAMRTAGVQPVLMGRDKNGRFMSSSQIQDRLNAAKK